MIASLSAWWRARSRREQILLLILSALFGITFAWLLVVRPLGDSLAAARERHSEAVIALAEARAGAAAIGRLERDRPSSAAGPVERIVTESASAAGFQLSRIQPEGAGKVALAIEAARPQALFAWVSEMETKNGLIVERLTANANSDRSLSAQIVFRARAISSRMETSADSEFAAIQKLGADGLMQSDYPL
ncbi:MAG TPA: type II secretion system protein GspM [Allosphingosinicella sp.]|nr:type II secretion system protein GspM [Allosphingosinicella sp.]